MFFSKISFAISLVLFCSFSFAQKSTNALVYEGNKKFDAENYEASSAKYLEAIAEKKDDYAAHYNLGNAFYKIKKYDLAAAEYEKANQLTKSKYEKAAALYNLGNVQMQNKNPEKALEYYKKSLQQDPYNDSVRKNFEIAKLRKKEKEDNNQKQKQGKKESDNSKNKDNSEEKDNNNKQKEGGQGDKKKGKGEGSPSQSKKNENRIPKAVEESILNEIDSREKETARRILNKNANRMPQSNEKDW